MYSILPFLLLVLIPVVEAENWGNFENNLASDIAPLVSLFGDELSKQFLSESISVLDNIIFALAPLGILTAVVSAIRVCGNSSIKAFVGRASEGPGEVEHELLSCVSETTAEVFNNAGISRVSGSPQILEIVTWEEEDPNLHEKSRRIGTLREALQCKAWGANRQDLSFEHEDFPELDIPNLSLNKGIRTKSKLWFALAFVLGCILQGGLIIYAAITVFVYPQLFLQDGSPVPSYAFTLFLVGTVFLFAGMFSCAFIIERASKELFFHPKQPSKVYWLQPGRQKVGDQVFGPFLAVDQGPKAQPTKDLVYIKSKPNRGFRVSPPQLIFIVFITMVGFIAQFLGLRRLHASVSLTQLAATLLMSLVRTGLRTDRISQDENEMVVKDRALTSHYQQELDCFAFYLDDVQSLSLLCNLAESANGSTPAQSIASSASSALSMRSGTSSIRSNSQLPSNLIQTRARLAELTSQSRKGEEGGWSDLPIRKMARNLAQTIETTMDLLSSWKNKHDDTATFNLTLLCQPGDCRSAAPSVQNHPVELRRSGDTLRWKIDPNQLEAILGLWVWSLIKSDETWLQGDLCRLVGLTEANASKEETDLYFHKWIFRQTEARMVASNKFSPSHPMFRLFPNDSQQMKVLVVKTENTLEKMAAQDIYIHFLNDAIAGLEELGGETNIQQLTNTSFCASNNRIDEVLKCFETSGLGSREDALLCIMPVLKRHNLLPELAADSPNFRRLVEGYIQQGKWPDAFGAMRWLSACCQGDEFERSISEFGYLCRRALIHPESAVRQIGFTEVCRILGSDIRINFMQDAPMISRPRDWIRLKEEKSWKLFQTDIGWLTWHICNKLVDGKAKQQALELLGASESSVVAGVLEGSQEQADLAKSAFIQLMTNKPQEIDDLDSVAELTFTWACQDDHEFLLNWLLTFFIEKGDKDWNSLYPLLLMVARSSTRSSIRLMVSHGMDINMNDTNEGTALTQMVHENKKDAILNLLANGASIDGGAWRGVTPLMNAASEGNQEMVQFVLQCGASINAKDRLGLTALFWATWMNHPEVVKYLLASGADVEATEVDGFTPLALAAKNDQLDMMLLLLQNGANINCQIDDGSTPLIIAVRENRPEAVKLLIDWGADCQKRNRNNETALSLAQLSEKHSIEAIIKEKCHS